MVKGQDRSTPPAYIFMICAALWEKVMKKIVLFLFVLSGLFGLVFAQPPKIHPETQEAKAKIQKMLSGLETEKDPYDISSRLWDFEMKVLSYRNNGMRYTPETTREISVRLIAMFNQFNDSDINKANKESVIEIIGLIDNSQEARDFFINILENGSERNRKTALLRIWPRGVRGDDIYNKVKSLVVSGHLKRLDSLDPLKRANPERAIKEIQDYARTTKDVAEFKGVGQLLSEYNQPELMEVIIDRYPEMKKKWNGYFGDDPARSIKTKLLLEIAELKEGAALRTVLEMLNQDGTSGEETLPIIKKKLESNDAISREAAIDFLSGQARQGNIKTDKIKPILEGMSKREKNKALRAKSEKLLKELR